MSVKCAVGTVRIIQRLGSALAELSNTIWERQATILDIRLVVVVGGTEMGSVGVLTRIFPVAWRLSTTILEPSGAIGPHSKLSKSVTVPLGTVGVPHIDIGVPFRSR